MTLRPEYMLGHSELNAFLYAPTGKDDAGQEETVLSILARRGLDPWAEATRLANMPRDAAVQALSGLLFQESREAPDTAAIAARLVEQLPRGGVQPIPVTHVAPTAATAALARLRPSMWLVCLAVAVAWFYFVTYMNSEPTFEPAQSTSTSN